MERSITVHFIANRMVCICVMERSITVNFIANRTVGISVVQKMNSNFGMFMESFTFYFKYLK